MEKESIMQLSALAHPQRLEVFRLLMRRFPQSVAAGDLAEALHTPRSTLSPYLSSLRTAGLVTQERDGTSLLYRAAPEGAERLIDFLFRDCCRGRPDLCLPLVNRKAEGMTPDKTFNVLFVCTGNSARSIFAETLLRAEGEGRFNAFSAGTAPRSELNPLALDLLRSKGHDVSCLRAKNIDEFRDPGAPQMDFVFTVCDRAANEECPPWSGQPITGHWGQPDPVKAEGTEAEKKLAFQHVYGALRNRIRAFAALPFESLDKARLQARIDDITDMDTSTS